MLPAQVPNPIFNPDDEQIIFLDEEIIRFGYLEQPEPKAPPQAEQEPSFMTGESEQWKVLIVDDEPDVHKATELALKNFQFAGKPLSFFSAYSSREGRHMISVDHPDVALILLDVVMETNDAGLQMVQYIREELKNPHVRIILRTGQPGEAPEESIILNYDINDYKLKIELTRQKLITSAVSALRSYRDIVTIEQQRQQLAETLESLQQAKAELEDYNRTLEMKVAERTAALEAANLELHRIATLDGLTLVANRRRFDDYWLEQWQLHCQQRLPLSLLLIDVDYFKNYNDYYGHLAGDKCLYEIANAVQAVLQRPSDLVARYGGEEFAVILPNTPLEGAVRVAQTVMAKVKSLQLPHVNSLTSDQVTISVGVGQVHPHPDVSPQTPIAITDKALYQAKRSGRNCYSIYQNPA
jgi:diguanylate cyclase (GGDEF)-like protein